MEQNAYNRPFWALDIKEAFSILESNARGLSDEEAEKRLREFGSNVIEGDRRADILKIFLSQFKSPLIFILIFAAGITLFLNDYVNFWVISFAILLNSSLGFYQENKAEKALEHLKSYLKERARVIRQGNEKEVDIKEIVPGDIVHVVAGSRVPADARLISSNDLHIEEGLLTGEALPAKKTIKLINIDTPLAERSNIVFSGTLVLEGSGVAIAYATDQYTELGKIAELVSGIKNEKTPLQLSIGKLAWYIAGLLTFIIGAIFVLGIVRGENIFSMFLIAVAMSVSAIPEALPVALTVILAVGVERLAKQNGIVRKLSAAESLGSTTVIITDKTGTLTEAKMKLSEIFTYDMLLSSVNLNQEPVNKLSEQKFEILKTALLNTDILVENPEDLPANWRLIGRHMERSIVEAGINYGILVNELREHVSSLLELQFNSVNKFSASFVQKSDEINLIEIGDKNFISFLGAPDILLEKSDISKDDFIKISEYIDKLSGEGKRLLGLAVKPLDVVKKLEKINPLKVKKLKFIGIIAFHDPIRKEVKAVMREVEELGANVIMATGDLPGTALYVGRQLGWNVTETNILTGASLKAMSEEELKADLKNIRIFARVSPEDKVRIARVYKNAGEIVAMTGDGVNDAPSLKAADIGVALGAGTDVTKDVADLVLLDDNFKTLISAIKEGRRMLANIKKSIIYLLSDALDEVFLIGGSLLVGLPLPLTALQILWVNFFSDSLPALSFAFEKNFENNIGKTKAKNVLDREVKFLVLVIGVSTSALLFVLYWLLLYFNFDVQLVKTFIFTAFGIYTLFLAFPLRSLNKNIFSYNPFSNKLLVLGVILGLILMFFAVYLPFFQNILNTTALPPVWLSAVAFWVLINIAIVEFAKLLFRNKWIRL